MGASAEGEFALSHSSRESRARQARGMTGRGPFLRVPAALPAPAVGLVRRRQVRWPQPRGYQGQLRAGHCSPEAGPLCPSSCDGLRLWTLSPRGRPGASQERGFKPTLSCWVAHQAKVRTRTNGHLSPFLDAEPAYRARSLRQAPPRGQRRPAPPGLAPAPAVKGQAVCSPGSAPPRPRRVQAWPPGASQTISPLVAVARPFFVPRKGDNPHNGSLVRSDTRDQAPGLPASFLLPLVPSAVTSGLGPPPSMPPPPPKQAAWGEESTWAPLGRTRARSCAA